MSSEMLFPCWIDESICQLRSVLFRLFLSYLARLNEIQEELLHYPRRRRQRRR